MNNFSLMGTINSDLTLLKSNKGKDYIKIAFLIDSNISEINNTTRFIYALDDVARNLSSTHQKGDYCLIEGYIEEDSTNLTNLYFLSSIKRVSKLNANNDFYLEKEGKSLKDYLLFPDEIDSLDDYETDFDFDSSESYDSHYKSEFDIFSENSDSGNEIAQKPEIAKKIRIDNKKDLVQSWRKSHPLGKKTDCIKELGLSKPTVLKWWDFEEEQDFEEEMG